MSRRVSLVLAALALAVITLFGSPTLARLAWLAGMPRAVLLLSDDAGLRGAALYRLGRYAEADALFASVPRGATYNRAASLAATGAHALSVAYYDAVLFADRWDGEARANRAVVQRLVPPVIGEARGHGRIGVIVAEAGTEVAAFDTEDPDAPTVISGVNHRRPVDAQAVRADAGWLDALEDAPGTYLQRRIAAEYDARVEAGVSHPPEPVPW
ncbi:hypothetical protein [Poseidonocella sedimentorum]|uniref:Ca-activated chloride channel family protein n=1 Tax=Poseidonocella sedimentorum TaxID=871652 RepID=A0A1I6E3Q8_9RHOB|nr:hypothetical protein [Poseidonocella sedimentorum]SFR12326.1 Ca-activated chloride channel family protein [Poseidonocella sedimentorum]